MTTTASTPSADKVHQIQATTTPDGEVRFALPIKPELVESVEAIDLDLMLTTTSGEKYILQQGALLATTNTESKLVFSNGDAMSAADQMKRMGVMKPVEGGSFRLASALTPEAADKVTGNEFGLGKDAQDTVAKIEKIIQALETATQSSQSSDANSAQGLGKNSAFKSNADQLASAAPGAPPKPDTKTSDNETLPNITFSLLAANKEGVNYTLKTATENIQQLLGKTEVRQLVGKSTVELNMGQSVQNLEFKAGLIENQLLLNSIPTTTSLILSINILQNGLKIPDGLKIIDLAGKTQSITAGTPVTIDISGMKNNQAALKLQWNEVSAAADSKFELNVAYIGPSGQTSLKTISFSGNPDNAYTLDGRGDPIQFITSQADNLIVTANDANNTITTGNGKDTIKGSGGADTINGGSGKDTVDYSASTAAVNVNVTSGAGTDGQAQDDQLSNIEVLNGSSATDTLNFSGASTDVTANLILGTSNQKLNGSDQDLTFSSFENVLGSVNNDSFVASSAVNDFKGGDGSDTVDYSNSAAVIVNLYTGIGADNHAAGDTYNSIENLIGGAGDDTFSASEAVNSFTGNAGVNRVNYEHSNVGVTINLSTGQGSGGFATGDRYNTIQNATGSNHNDTFVANNQGNKFVGGNGTDTVSYENATAQVTVNLLNNTGSGSDAQGDTYSSIENAVGSAHNDTFVSGAGANRFEGLGGNNTLSYAGSTAINVNLQTGAVSGGHAVGDTLVGIQNLTGGDGDDVLTGDGLANTLTGGAGADTLSGGAENDILDGGAGNDTLDGGAGDDTLKGGVGADRFTGGAGTDTVSYADSSAVSIDINFNGTGNIRGGADAAGDVIGSDIEKVLGSAKDDTFFGTRTGVLLDGGAGTDSIDFFGTASGVVLNLGNTAQFMSIERVVGSNFDDDLTASNSGSAFVAQKGNDTLTGGSGADTFNLDTGNNTLVGDVANGGGGKDTFVIRQSTVGGSVVNLDGGSDTDTLRVFAGATLDLSSLNAKNFEKLNLRDDGASTQVSLSKSDILALVDNNTRVLTLRLDSADSYLIEPETGITVTQGQSVNFYNGSLTPANLVAQVNFEYV